MNILSQNRHNKSNYSSWFMMRVDTQTIFGNLQCRKFNCSSCRCLYRIKIFVVALFLIYPNIILQRQSYVFDFGYYYAHTSALIMIRHRLDSFLRMIKKNACLIFKDEAPLCGPMQYLEIIVFRKLVISLITVSDTSRQRELALASSMPNGRQSYRKTVQLAIGSGVLFNMPHQILQGACKQI